MKLLPPDAMSPDIKLLEKNIVIGIINVCATEAIFPKTNKEHEFSRYQHLGKAGSVPHIDGVQAVVRRGQIEVLTQAIEALKESWLDLYSNEKKAGHRVE